MNTIVQVNGLRKTYGGGATVAVDGVSFEVGEGEIFGVVGPNGAGKTTTIECLEGLRKPDAGTLRVLGVDPQEAGQRLCLCAGMQLQQSNLPDRMKVWEALDTYAAFYPKTVDWNELLVQLGLDEKRNTAFAKLSGGQKQRLFIALALLHDPQLVFLDELTTGLDPQARHAIWDLVRKIRERGKTVILSTHFMEEAERLCDRVAILDHGKIVALDRPEALIRAHVASSTALGVEERVVFSLDKSLPAGFEKTLSGAVRIEVQGERVVISSDPKGSGKPSGSAPLVSEVVAQLTAQGIPFRDLRTEQANLEDVFLSLTGEKES
jgi:ABC-2 type transport system ATP-binding protein